MIEKFLRLLFHPLTFAIGFLAPLTTQSLIALEVMTPGFEAVIVGLAVGIGFGLLAMMRGSWIWVK